MKKSKNICQRLAKGLPRKMIPNFLFLLGMSYMPLYLLNYIYKYIYIHIYTPPKKTYIATDLNFFLASGCAPNGGRHVAI